MRPGAGRELRATKNSHTSGVPKLRPLFLTHGNSPPASRPWQPGGNPRAPFALSPLSRRAILAQCYVKAGSLPAETSHVERDLNREMPTATRPNENGD